MIKLAMAAFNFKDRRCFDIRPMVLYVEVVMLAD
jgi:hypothetical protein